MQPIGPSTRSSDPSLRDPGRDLPEQLESADHPASEAEAPETQDGVRSRGVTGPDPLDVVARGALAQSSDASDSGSSRAFLTPGAVAPSLSAPQRGDDHYEPDTASSRSADPGGDAAVPPSAPGPAPTPSEAQLAPPPAQDSGSQVDGAAAIAKAKSDFRLSRFGWMLAPREDQSEPAAPGVASAVQDAETAVLDSAADLCAVRHSVVEGGLVTSMGQRGIRFAGEGETRMDRFGNGLGRLDTRLGYAPSALTFDTTAVYDPNDPIILASHRAVEQGAPSLPEFHEVVHACVDHRATHPARPANLFSGRSYAIGDAGGLGAVGYSSYLSHSELPAKSFTAVQVMRKLEEAVAAAASPGEDPMATDVRVLSSLNEACAELESAAQVAESQETLCDTALTTCGTHPARTVFRTFDSSEVRAGMDALYVRATVGTLTNPGSEDSGWIISEASLYAPESVQALERVGLSPELRGQLSAQLTEHLGALGESARRQAVGLRQAANGLEEIHAEGLEAIRTRAAPGSWQVDPEKVTALRDGVRTAGEIARVDRGRLIGPMPHVQWDSHELGEPRIKTAAAGQVPGEPGQEPEDPEAAEVQEDRGPDQQRATGTSDDPPPDDPGSVRAAPLPDDPDGPREGRERVSPPRSAPLESAYTAVVHRDELGEALAKLRDVEATPKQHWGRAVWAQTILVDVVGELGATPLREEIADPRGDSPEGAAADSRLHVVRVQPQGTHTPLDRLSEEFSRRGFELVLAPQRWVDERGAEIDLERRWVYGTPTSLQDFRYSRPEMLVLHHLDLMQGNGAAFWAGDFELASRGRTIPVGAGQIQMMESARLASLIAERMSGRARDPASRALRGDVPPALVAELSHALQQVREHGSASLEATVGLLSGILRKDVEFALAPSDPAALLNSSGLVAIARGEEVTNSQGERYRLRLDHPGAQELIRHGEGLPKAVKDALLQQLGDKVREIALHNKSNVHSASRVFERLKQLQLPRIHRYLKSQASSQLQVGERWTRRTQAGRRGVGVVRRVAQNRGWA